MKKINLIIALIVAVTFFSALVFAPGSVSSQKEKKEAVANQIPDSLAKIFKVSCTPCHYDGGSKAACFGLNCSGWSQKEVRLCVIPDCPLYPYRSGKNPSRKGIGGSLKLKAMGKKPNSS